MHTATHEIHSVEDAAKKALSSTLFSPKFYSTDYAAMDKLNEVFGAASQEMYNAANAQGSGAEPGSDAGAGSPQDEVTDVDFEEVKDK